MIPYNRDLIMKFQAYINIEIYNHSRSVKYLFKYVNKGPDKATVIVWKTGSSELDKNLTDSNMSNEIKTYLDCRSFYSHVFLGVIFYTFLFYLDSIYCPYIMVFTLFKVLFIPL